MNTNIKISPWWLTGFTQADGSFMIIIKKQPKGKIPYRLYPCFTLTQNKIDITMMKSIHSYLGVGRLVINRNRVDIVVSSMNDLLDIIIPHFDKYPPRRGKLISYLIFRTVVLAMKDKVHSSPEGFLKLLDLSYFTHNTSTRTIESKQVIENRVGIINKSKDFVPIDFSGVSVTSCVNLNKDFVAGLFDGDGNLGFSFRKRKIQSFFQITQGIDDYSLLLELITFFQCGNVSSVWGNKREARRYRVSSISNLVEKVQPVLESVELKSIKRTYLEPSFEA